MGFYSLVGKGVTVVQETDQLPVLQETSYNYYTTAVRTTISNEGI